MKPFLVLQLRPETEAADDEFRAIMRMGGLSADQVRRIRMDRDDLPADLDLSAHSGVIVGGGPGCVSDPPGEKTPTEARIEEMVMGLMPQITAHDIPFLGCCYGIGILGHHLGAEVSKARYGEKPGTALCRITEAGRDDPLMEGMPGAFEAFVGHKEALQELPAGCAHLLVSDSCPFQMIRYGRNVYATQFHPEADAAGFALRIRIYRNEGYFRPEEAERLTEMCHRANVHAPARLLRNFVARYRRD